jgi:hypothetical protein
MTFSFLGDTIYLPIRFSGRLISLQNGTSYIFKPLCVKVSSFVPFFCQYDKVAKMCIHAVGPPNLIPVTKALTLSVCGWISYGMLQI